MLLIIDENVPNPAADLFREPGHDVRPVRELFPMGTADPIIAALGDRLSAIVVTWNHRDFKRLATRIPIGSRQQFRNLGRIDFRCREERGRQRIERYIELIEFVYAQAQQQRDKRLLV